MAVYYIEAYYYEIVQANDEEDAQNILYDKVGDLNTLEDMMFASPVEMKSHDDCEMNGCGCPCNNSTARFCLLYTSPSPRDA